MSGTTGKKRSGGKRGEGVTVIIRREEESGHAHHGGAWKVAYADFVTAMMAFFLLMWLLNATTEEQRRGLADYFSPTNMFGRSVSGSGQMFGGTTPNSEGSMTSDMGAVRIERGPRPAVTDVEDDDSDTPAQPTVYRDGGQADRPAGGRQAAGGEGGSKPLAGAAPRGQTFQATPWQTIGEGRGGGSRPADTPGESQETSDPAVRAEAARREKEAFDGAAARIKGLSQDPQLAGLAKQLSVEETPDGLRIQLLDSEGQPMFAAGAGAPNERAKALLRKVAGIASSLTNQIAVTGHTDAAPFRGAGDRSNWDLSSERANATRRILTEAGISESRIRSVAGLADRELLVPGQPSAAANRRVTILLLREAPAPAATR